MTEDPQLYRAGSADTEIAVCPCGQVPEKLIVDDSGHARCALVSGYCCGEWAIGFRTNRSKFDSEENIRRARVAWNAAPRGNGNELLVDDLASLLRRLAHSLRKAEPGNDLAERALDYLKRHGTRESVLRDPTED